MLGGSRAERCAALGFAWAFSLAASGLPTAVDALPYLDGVIPVSEGNAEARRSQRDAEGEGGEF